MNEGQGRRKRVLIVDDNKNQVETLARFLRRNGYEVRGTQDGPSALAELREFLPDFALIDIGLPGLNGYDLARLIREEKDFAQTTLIAQTAWAGEEDRAASRRAGFDFHLGKPINLDRLQKILND